MLCDPRKSTREVVGKFPWSDPRSNIYMYSCVLQVYVRDICLGIISVESSHSMKEYPLFEQHPCVLILSNGLHETYAKQTNL